MRGSTAINGAVDGWWQIGRKGRFNIIETTLRDATEIRLGVEVVHENGRFSFVAQ